MIRSVWEVSCGLWYERSNYLRHPDQAPKIWTYFVLLDLEQHHFV